ERVVRGEDRELARRSSLRVVRRAERDEPADTAAVAELDEVTHDEAAEAVADDVDPPDAGLPAHFLDPLGEPGARGWYSTRGRQAVVVEAGTVGKSREIPGATAREEASQEDRADEGGIRPSHLPATCLSRLSARRRSVTSSDSMPPR